MSHLRYYNYPGVGTQNQERFSYSQAVRIGDRIECAGQGEFSNIKKENDACKGDGVGKGKKQLSPRETVSTAIHLYFRSCLLSIE